MKGISCDKELITERYDYLKKNMTPDSHLSIFHIRSWCEPWGFGRENVADANKLYKEVMTCLGYVDDPDECNLRDDDYADFIFITLKSKDQIGIIYVVESYEDLPEYIENLFNHVAAQIPNKALTLGAVSEPRKPDNLVINRLKLFNNDLPSI